MSIIAVDFDGTLCQHKYPKIGNPFLKRIKWLIQWRKEYGNQLILLTCRDKQELEEAVSWCKGYGLEFDAINDDVNETKITFVNKSIKIYADLYIDDRNVSLENLDNLIERTKCLKNSYRR